MPDDGQSSRRTKTTERQDTSRWLALPRPLKQLFDKFPLVTYASNKCPQSASRNSNEHHLFIFTTPEDARLNAPSFNPGCLKWQTYLKMNQVAFRTAVSNNHASPTGSLPFLVTSTEGTDSKTISSRSFRQWTAAQSGGVVQQESEGLKLEAYQSLIEGRLRLAWLYQLYLNPTNQPVVQRLYLAPTSSNTLVQLTIAHQLRRAADAELYKSEFLRRKDEEELWQETADALFALSTLLGDRLWFSDQKAGYFDASVFAYTHLILSDNIMHWQSNRLAELLLKHENLVVHRDRMLELYY